MEHGEEAPRNEIEHTTLVGREGLDVMVDVGRNDRVVVGDLRVVDHTLQRQLVEREHILRRLRVVGDRFERPGSRLGCGTMSPDR